MQNTVRYGFLVIAKRPHHGSTSAHVLMRWVLDDDGTTTEEFHLLLAFLLQGLEVLVVLMTDIGDDAYIRADDRFQSLHLAGLTDSRLEDSQ